jgi:thiosulfate/3-mercaptopyruvate sulfurtransferase
MRCWHPIIMAVIVCLVSASARAERGYPRNELLLEPTDLAKAEAVYEFVILDVRKQEVYDQGHLPGARRVDHDTWKAAFGDGKDVEGWSKRIGDLGMAMDSKVVVYDDLASKDAARIWWILRFWGLDDVRLLNGGWKTWTAKKLPTTADEPKPAKPAVFHAKSCFERLVTMDQVVDMLNGDRLQIIDARSHDEFCGIDKKKNKRAGAIPGAKHLEWSDLIDEATDRFKSPQQLRRLFDEAGIDLAQPTASHCQSGGRASVMVFGLELMGAKDARNYHRGWSEWGNSEDTPIAVPEEMKSE